jgi:hypothetical protein
MFTLVTVTFFSIGKSWLRLKAVELVLDQYLAKLRRQMIPQISLWLLAPALFFYNSFAAWISRRVIWRDTTYEMVSYTETKVLQRDRG